LSQCKRFRCGIALIDDWQLAILNHIHRDAGGRYVALERAATVLGKRNTDRIAGDTDHHKDGNLFGTAKKLQGKESHPWFGKPLLVEYLARIPAIYC